MSTFKSIIGGKENTPEEVYAKFPWLIECSFVDADVDITNSWLIWEDGIWKYGIWKYGVWEYGVWKNGIWKDGTWEDGTWEDGIWEDGIWEDGKMWNNFKQTYVPVALWDKEKKEFS